MTPAGLRSLFRHHRLRSQVRTPIRIDFATPSELTWCAPASPCPPPASDGAFADSHHHALRPTRAPGRLARICPGRRKTRPLVYHTTLMSQPRLSLEEIFAAHIQTLALTLRPNTVGHYRSVASRFLSYLRAAFPRLRRLSQLRRDPHLLGWFRWLCEQDPPCVQYHAAGVSALSSPPVP